MEKHRINTTISAKHWEILKRHAAKYESQQKTIELALESLEDKSEQIPGLSSNEQLWMSIGRDMSSSISLVHKSFFDELIETADCERMFKIYAKLRPAEYLVVWYYKKPLKKCSLEEVIEGIILTTRMGNWFNTMNHKDNFNHYTIEINHELKMKGSILFTKFFEDLFEAYGVKTESEISETGFFIKVFKKHQIM